VAVVVDAWSVVARRTAVEAKLPDGYAGWFKIVPNRSACADRDLCRAAFMAGEDASAFVLKLASLGLEVERDGVYRDVAIVGKGAPWEHACPWIHVGRYGGVDAAWLDGGDPEPLVVPISWGPHGAMNLSDEEVAKRLEFVRREGGIEVWIDTKTGEEMYRGRTTPSGDLDPEVEQRFQAAVESIKPLLSWDGRPKRLGWFERRRLAKGIRELEALASGDRWRVWWFLGMARRAASDPNGAFGAFERAYETNPAHADVSREFGGQCLALGRGEQAVVVSERNCTVHPRDAGLRSNLALACVIAGDMTRAKVEVSRALELDPEDKVTRALAKMIDDVIAGKRARMTKYP
jgi:hypothetical protein